MIRQAPFKHAYEIANWFQWTRKNWISFVSHSLCESDESADFWAQIDHPNTWSLDITCYPFERRLEESLAPRSVQLIQHQSSTKNHYTMFLFFRVWMEHKKDSYYSCFLQKRANKKWSEGRFVILCLWIVRWAFLPRLLWLGSFNASVTVLMSLSSGS